MAQTIGDIFDTMSNEQRDIAYALIGSLSMDDEGNDICSTFGIPKPFKKMADLRQFYSYFTPVQAWALNGSVETVIDKLPEEKVNEHTKRIKEWANEYKHEMVEFVSMFMKNYLHFR